MTNELRCWHVISSSVQSCKWQGIHLLSALKPPSHEDFGCTNHWHCSMQLTEQIAKSGVAVILALSLIAARADLLWIGNSPLLNASARKRHDKQTVWLRRILLLEVGSSVRWAATDGERDMLERHLLPSIQHRILDWIELCSAVASSVLPACRQTSCSRAYVRALCLQLNVAAELSTLPRTSIWPSSPL